MSKQIQFCKNIKCKKKITNYYLCKVCNYSFCSNICLNLHHSTDEHKLKVKLKGGDNINDISISSSGRPSDKRCVFMKLGRILNEVYDNPDFNRNNFDYVKINGKKKIIGEGAFSKLYLVRHFKTLKEYAMKIVSF